MYFLCVYAVVEFGDLFHNTTELPIMKKYIGIYSIHIDIYFIFTGW